MLKSESKRRRTKKEIEEQKQSELERENEIRTKLARLEQVEAELQVANEQAQINKQAAVLVSDMINKGVVQQQDENSFIAMGQEGPERFDYDQEQQ